MEDFADIAGNHMVLSSDEADLEQLIKGGPFELGLYADKLGSHMFGIDSATQVRPHLPAVHLSITKQIHTAH